MRTYLVVLLAALLLPASVAADPQACSSDEDCPENSSCVRVPCATCPMGEECPPCEPEGYCSPDGPEGFFGAECDNDADCPEGFTCEEHSFGSCGGTATCPACDCVPCPEGEECPDCECPPCEPEEPPDCEEETVHLCVFHPAQCSQDQDCDPGFVCYQEEICSGGGATSCACEACPDGEDCPPCECPEEPEIPEDDGCELVGGVCAPDQIACAGDGECPDGWECVELAFLCACDCGCAAPPCPEGEECPPPDCECPPCECEEDAERYCLPPGWDDMVTAAADRGPLPEAPEGGGQQEAGAGLGKLWDRDGDGHGQNTPGDNTGGGGGGGASNTSGGCAVIPPIEGGTPALGFILLIGLLAGIRRRRS